MKNRSMNVSALIEIRSLFILLLGLALLASPWSSRAGGLYINEFGTPSMGVAGAGAEAVASDASTSFHNPAGMTRLDGKELMLTGGLLYSTVKFDSDPDTPIQGGDGGEQGSPAPLLGAFYAHSLTERLKVGANVISITGAVLDPDDDWTGRFQLQEVSLLTVTINPSIAYRITDWLSVGAGLAVMYADLELEIAAPPPTGMGSVAIDGDDWEFGFNLGVLFELGERTRLGLIYWSEIEPNFGGDVKIEPLGIQTGVDTELPFAQFARASIYHEINDQFAILGTVGWEDWSTFDNVNISVARGSAKLPRNWDDTWKFAAGLHYRPVEKWLLQTGIAYDTSPTDSDDRTADMPMDQQLRLAVGAQYKWNEKFSLGGAFEYACYGDAKIDSSLLRGHYDWNDLFFFAVNANLKF